MKSAITVLSAAALLSIAGLASAQMTAPTPAAATPAPAPQVTNMPPVDPTAPPNAPIANPKAALQFEKMWTDWGKISDSTPVVAKFKFKNVSKDRTVKISDIHTSCGCTTSNLDKREYAPGEEGELVVNYNPQGKRGLERKITTLTTDDPEATRIELLGVALVQPKVIIEPLSLFMGERFLENNATPTTQRISITGRTKDFSVTNPVISDTNNYTIEALPPDVVEVDGEKLNRFQYNITFKPNLAMGNYPAQLSFDTNEPTRLKVVTSVMASVVGKLAVMPDKLPLRFNGPGSPFTAEAWITSRVNPAQPFEILSAEVEGTGARFAVDVVPNQPGVKTAYRVKVSGKAPADGIISGKLKVRTDVKDQEEIVVDLLPMNAQVNQPLVPANQPKPETKGH
jgi:hypothetical protein